MPLAYDASVVDLHAFMDKVIAKHQPRDPRFTHVGGDRVLPDAVSHSAVAYAISKALRTSGIPWPHAIRNARRIGVAIQAPDSLVLRRAAT